MNVHGGACTCAYIFLRVIVCVFMCTRVRVYVCRVYSKMNAFAIVVVLTVTQFGW